MSFEIVTEIMQELCKTKQLDNSDKGQLISEWNFGVFKSPKNATRILTDFCPSFIGQKFV